MWKIALLVVSGLALKVQKEAQHTFPSIQAPPSTVDGGVASIDAQQITSIGLANQFITDNEADANGQINDFLTVLADEGGKFMRELQDQNLMKDEIKYAPWEVNRHQITSVGAIQSFGAAEYKAAGNMGIPLVGVDIHEDDLSLDWYRKKGLILPPFPQVDVNLPILWTASMKQSIARVAHELETLESDPLLVYKPCTDLTSVDVCGPAGPTTLCGACECFNDVTGDKVPGTTAAAGESCAVLVIPTDNIR